MLFMIIIYIHFCDNISKRGFYFNQTAKTMLTFLLIFVYVFKFGTCYIKTCNVTDYGAKPDGKTDNTHYIQSAINECGKASINSNDLSLVILPSIFNNDKQSVYLSGALFLRSNLG